MKESSFLEKILRIGRKIIPKKIFKAAQPIYHYVLAITGAVIYRFPAKKMIVIGVTGTKGKSTTTEMVNAILEADGKKTALASTIRYKIGDKEWRNLFKMTLRGRFFTQSFLRKALDAGCTHAIIEMSSEGVPQFRHKFLFPDILIFTNLAPEHIESHGSYENYVKAKLSIAKELEEKKSFPMSKKLNTAIIANTDDKEGEKFLALNIKNKIPYSIHDAINVKSDSQGSSFQIGKTIIYSKLPGTFNVYNMLGATACAKFLKIGDESIKKGLENLKFVRGRMEKVDCGQSFDVVVDYAHTPDSLRAAYESYAPRLTTTKSRVLTSSQEEKKQNPKNYKKENDSDLPKKDGGYYLIGILGNTGGGRDKWKRKEMGKIADEYCDQIILTNEDPYDEDPKKIVEEMKEAIVNKPVEIIMDRREAIHKALQLAQIKTKELASEQKENNVNKKVAVLITGKGTDPYIMEANGKKIPWDDVTVVREEIAKYFE